jgi:hypothetical protein
MLDARLVHRHQPVTNIEHSNKDHHDVPEGLGFSLFFNLLAPEFGI